MHTIAYVLLLCSLGRLINMLLLFIFVCCIGIGKVQVKSWNDNAVAK